MPAKRQIHTTGTKWEDSIGYCRALKIGELIEVSGTVASDEGKLVGKGDPYKQAQFILQKIEKAIKALGGEMKDVVRTRIYVKDIKHWDKIGKAHAEYFRNVKPATTMVEVSQMINPGFLVEIEATAYKA